MTEEFGYWSGIEYAAELNHVWYMGFKSGRQEIDQIPGNNYYALAVMTGDVTVVPEPISSILFIAGGVILSGKIYIKRKFKLF